MSLDKYKKKRDFNATNEPEGEIGKSETELIFVVQQHAASHLHYDFRLEMGGVLKSWAIPKGPSMNPADKRLAIMVEDHPYSYKDFEGIIPEGNYGAGSVIVWDNGTYSLVEEQKNNDEIENILETDLQKGHLSFILKGKKLKGEFALVKLKIKQKNAWLLIKKSDDFALNTNILEENKSVVSNLTLEDLKI
ncbi:bifunctional non-homologous end joining protein LigD [Flavobacterium sp. CG_23.5]|uniref:DNA polymerase ligase N-terminal domain-containing protein n=1 Tax=unclassified Flavobacterium TaxID=196869 RepID=UPI0018CA40F8|nr:MULTISPECIES: DNA polymerase ligase N-terminal domain-containing protein [unclassified Flavobacterium]MBG6109697.1 bifunctional non-homologous end joining protein LigD [Flavobacterium sp. CG_9.10]MBP2284731.1 bifunctional non-homologous end joining protein LigD [Flavobacterium sp. CG_23.5]